MTEPIRIRLTPDELKSVCVQTHQDGDVRLPDGTWGKPTAQGDYDPAISALCGITLRDPDGDAVGLCSQDARTILAAIKMGKVPGVAYMPYAEAHMQRQCSDIAAKDAALAKRRLQVKEMHAEIARLKADLAAEREQKQEASSKYIDRCARVQELEADLAAADKRHNDAVCSVHNTAAGDLNNIIKTVQAQADTIAERNLEIRQLKLDLAAALAAAGEK